MILGLLIVGASLVVWSTQPRSAPFAGRPETASGSNDDRDGHENIVARHVPGRGDESRGSATRLVSEPRRDDEERGDAVHSRSVSGTVVTASGSGVPDADVLWIEDREALLDWWFRVEHDLATISSARELFPSTTTGADGTFTLDVGAADAMTPWHDSAGALDNPDLVVLAPGFAARVVSCAAARRASVALGTVVVERGCEVVGTVSSDTGMPLTGARIDAVGVGRARGVVTATGATFDTFKLRGFLGTTTGGDGRFALPVALDGTVDLRVSAEGRTSAHLGGLHVVPGETLDVGEVSLASGTPVTVLVRADGMSAVADAWVWKLDGRAGAAVASAVDPIGAAMGATTPSRGQRTDGEGKAGFALSELPAAVLVETEGYEPAVTVVEEPQTQPVTIVLRPAAAWGVEVRAAETQKLVSGAAIEVVRLGSERPSGRRPTVLRGREAHALYDLSGEPSDARAVIAPCGTGAFRVTVCAEGFARQEFTLEAVSSDSIPWRTVLLQAESVIQGRVVHETGDPVSGATVTCTRRNDGRLDEASRRSTRADADGLFSFTRLGTGEFMLEATASGSLPSDSLHVSLVAGATIEDVELALSRGARLFGFVTNSRGQPVARQRILARHVATGNQLTVFSDGDGGFVVPVLPPGLFRVLAPPAADETVALEPGEDARIDLVVASPPLVTGRVMAAGVPVTGATVRLARQRLGRSRPDWTVGERTTSAERGHFTIEGFQAGTYHVWAEHGDTGFSAPHELLLGLDHDVTVDLHLGDGSIGGSLALDDGSPAAFAQVKASIDFGSTLQSRVATTGADGRFTLSGLPPGRYRLETPRTTDVGGTTWACDALVEAARHTDVGELRP